MKFSFKIQQYQTDAVDAVARVFQGQPYNAGVSYLRDMGSLSAQPQQLSLVSNGDDATQLELQDLINDSGFKNEALQLTDQELLQNIRAVQASSQRCHQLVRLMDVCFCLQRADVLKQLLIGQLECFVLKAGIVD